jgi:ribosomal protein S18 acetylase RimI-like enzyme
VWGQVRHGDAAVVWPPQWTTSTSGTEPDPLVVGLLQALAARGVTSAQSLVSDRASPEAATLVGCGFRHLADLRYLSAPATARPAAGLPNAGALEFVPVDASNRDRLATVVEETYRETLDCPALDGLRPTADVLAEYRTIGSGGESLWRLIRGAGRDVGCLLLADHPTQDQVELVYMGLVPAVRGRQWGEVTVGEALRLAQQRGRATVVLAVDAANSPAAAMYERAGFTVFDERTALLFRADWGAGKS